MATAMIMAMAMGEKRPRHRFATTIMAKSRRKPISGRAAGRGIALAVLTVVLAGASVGNSIANITADRSPELALRFSPLHPVALAAKADSEWRRGREDEATRLAIESIRSTPLSSAALQTLGLIEASADRDLAAARLLKHASRLNQREVPAQIWLFQQELFAGNIEAALLRLDTAMRVSEESRSTLFPLLAGAMTADDLTGSIASVFAKEPVWLQGFLRYAVHNRASLPNLARIIAMLPEDPTARTIPSQTALVAAMAKAGTYSEARAFLQEIAPARAGGAIRDPSFTAAGKYAPFDWDYVSAVGIGASPAATGGLRYVAEMGRGGPVVRQLILLDAGAYRLVTAGRTLTSNNDGSAVWSIRCAGEMPSDLVQLTVPSQPKEQAASASEAFVVPPSGCVAQWLELVIGATFSPGGVQGEVDMVQVLSASAG